MIPAPSLTVACPACGAVHEDPQHVVYSVWASTLYSDLDQIVYSNARPRPKYVRCGGCGRVMLRADFVPQGGPHQMRPAKWVEASTPGGRCP